MDRAPKRSIKCLENSAWPIRYMPSRLAFACTTIDIAADQIHRLAAGGATVVFAEHDQAIEEALASSL